MARGPDPAIVGAPDMAHAIAVADEKATVLDERHYIEDMAVYHWLRAHQLPGRGHVHLVMGSRRSAPLLFNWPSKKFLDARQAGDFLAGIARDKKTLAALGQLGRELRPPVGAATAADLAKALAPALLSGELWATEVPRPPVRDYVSKTSPSAFAAIGGPYRIDYAYIAGLEGDQWLRGYVPMNAKGTIGRSGMTVASGFDIGQWSVRQLQDMKFPQPLLNKLLPFAGVPFAYLHPHAKATPMTKAEVVALVAKLGPVPVLEKTEADLCDQVVFGHILADAASAWDRKRSKGVPAFTAMPGGWQTVWLSRNYQEGPTAKSAAAKSFRAHALAGEWKEAVTALQSYKEYTSRARQEAAKLSGDMPAELPKPAASGTAKTPPKAATPAAPGKPAPPPIARP